MARDVAEIDRLIEQGLTRYGQGDLDGALLIWEQALAIEPDNAQANSYVDYVRMNYELLTADADGETNAPYGIGDDEPEYQIEILSTDAAAPLGPSAAPAPLYMDPLDEGWFIEGESGRTSYHNDEHVEEPEENATLELEADEPPETNGSSAGISFDDQTREYPHGAGRPDADLLGPDPVTTEFQNPEHTPGFGSPADLQTPAGFGTQRTDVRQRDLGFVRAVGTSDPAPASLELPLAPPPPVRAGARRTNEPPELKMTLRTPAEHRAETEADPPSTADEFDERDTPPPPASSRIELSYGAADLDLPTGPRAPIEPPPEDDLIASLPNPRRAHAVHSPITRELPGPVVPPAELPSVAAPTRELPRMDLPAVGSSHTRDFSERPTQQVPSRVQAAITAAQVEEPPLTSAPTRELGLRPPRAATEDEPTMSTTRPMPPTVPLPVAADPQGTRTDFVLSFDPIDARTAQINAEVDEGAPAIENKEDRTRRRISTLLDRAAEWSRNQELDRAVAAVDLALSEDASTALAQKLIQRNRDTIMSVFQAFLGDLQRQPVLSRPLHELGTAKISPRAAFLLSRVDGTLSLDEILDVSGMPRLEAYRYLCQLFLRGILR